MNKMICFHKFFCINRITFILLTLLSVIVSIYFYNEKKKSEKYNLKNDIDNLRLEMQLKDNLSKDHRRLKNPLEPPEYTYPSFKVSLPINRVGIPININSRGPNISYQMMGTLTHTDEVTNETTLYPLYGRPTYSGSSNYNYYTQNDKYNPIKIPITLNGKNCVNEYGCSEIYDGDTIDLHNKTFNVQLYGLDAPKYIPYIY